MAVTVLLMLSLYAAVGGLFGLIFVWRGMLRLDAVTRGAPLSFRLLILPGAAALWPLLTIRWYRAVRRGGKP